VLEHDLHPTNTRDQSIELDKAPTLVDRVNGVHASEGEQLLPGIMRISNVLVDLGMLPIQNIPQLPKSAWEVLLVADLVLKCLQEVLRFGASPWDGYWDDHRACDFGSSAPSLF
jgi:hypothetical protein